MCDDNVDIDLLLNLLDKEEYEDVWQFGRDAEAEKAEKEAKLKTATVTGRQDNKQNRSPENVYNNSKKESVASSHRETNKKSEIHSGETDSSDDENNKYAHEQKYSEYGRSVKYLLELRASPSQESHIHSSSSSLKEWKNTKARTTHAAIIATSKPTTSCGQKTSVGSFREPISGIRVSVPLVTELSLKEGLIGRQAVCMSNIMKWMNEGNKGDWVTAGVIVGATPPKTSQKGNKYIIWTMSDLGKNLTTVNVFLFNSSYHAFWKTDIGTVVGFLNPKVMEKREGSKESASIGIDTAQNVLIIGKSKDYGLCKSKKNDGLPCKQFVNTDTCEHCIYHAQKAYRQCSSKRSELQSATSSHQRLRNKVLGKNEVFYGGQSYAAIPAKASKKQTVKDSKRLQLLSGTQSQDNYSELVSAPFSRNVPVPNRFQQRLDAAHKRDQLRLAKLEAFQAKEQQSKLGKLMKSDGGELRTNLTLSSPQSERVYQKLDRDAKASPSLTSNYSKSFPTSASSQQKVNSNVKQSPSLALPAVSEAVRHKFELNKFEKIEFSYKIKSRHEYDQELKKKQLARILQEKRNKKSEYEEAEAAYRLEAIKRRVEDDVNRNSKKKCTKPSEVLSPGAEQLKSKFEQLLATNSRHMDLVEAATVEAQDEYFNKLEQKEKLEEKMLSTYKVDCKAVKCLKCKYTAFSSSDLCKRDYHPIIVIDAVKRFFKCHDCNNRTVSLSVIPVVSCSNCGGSHWERAPMMREKKMEKPTVSIFGNNEKVDGYNGDANLNLLVPD